MKANTKEILKDQLRSDLPEVHAGNRIKIWQKIKEGGKERVSPFEGVVIARKHGKGISATITVRADIKGIWVEKVFPIHSPTIDKIEIIDNYKTRRAKLYYLRTAKGKRARLKRKKTKTASS